MFIQANALDRSCYLHTQKHGNTATLSRALDINQARLIANTQAATHSQWSTIWVSALLKVHFFFLHMLKHWDHSFRVSCVTSVVHRPVIREIWPQKITNPPEGRKDMDLSVGDIYETFSSNVFFMAPDKTEQVSTHKRTFPTYSLTFQVSLLWFLFKLTVIGCCILFCFLSVSTLNSI